MCDINKFVIFENYYLNDLLDIYFDINKYCKYNAFDILNTDNINKNSDFIEMIFKNINIPLEDDNIDEEDEVFFYLD